MNGIENAGLAFLLAEYETLREESSQARQAQQTTLTWSVAAIAAVFAGGLVFVSTVVTPKTAAPDMAVDFYALVFGLAIPGYAFFAALTYVGELQRMERAGAYLRGLEDYLGQFHLKPPAPLRWESTLSWGRDAGRKLWAPVIGALGLYGGSLLISVTAFWVGTSLYARPLGRLLVRLRRLPHVLLPDQVPLPNVTTAGVAKSIPGIIAWMSVCEIIFFALVIFVLLAATKVQSRGLVRRTGDQPPRR